jgi:Predicted transcriptional regulators
MGKLFPLFSEKNFTSAPSNENLNVKARKSSINSNNYRRFNTSSEEINALVNLGLSGRQARVYLALLKTGEAKARTVATLTMIDRQEIYRLLDSLQQLGLIRQNVSAPISYLATPIDEVIPLLLDQKRGELNSISRKANHLIKKINEPSYFAPLPIQLKPSFGVVIERDGGRRYQKAVEESKRSIEVITSWLRFKKFCFLEEAQLKSALKNGVMLCIATEKPQSHNLPKWVETATLRHPNFKLKTMSRLPDAAVTTFDKTLAAIAFNVSTSLTRGPTFWTTNTQLCAFCNAYFNEVWAKVTEESPV